MKFSIRYKFAIGLLIIFSFSFNLMVAFINKTIMSNTEEIIKKELLSSQKDINIYLKQFFIINNLKVSMEDFETHAEFIGLNLSNKLNNRAIFYTINENLLYDSDFSNGSFYSDDGSIIDDDFNDLHSAKNGQSSYKIVNYNDRYKIIFSQPLNLDGTTIGILRYSKDYTEIFQSSNILLTKLKISILIMFFVLFLFSLLLSTKISVPIIKLNKLTKEISDGNYDVDLLVNSNDEIGELGKSFNIMKSKIKKQIRTIEKDRDDLIKLESHRKAFFDNVTHEMKTPLTIIDGYAQMILDEGISDEKLAIKAASKIKRESNKLHNMVVDVLNMSKLNSTREFTKKEKINITNIINNICNDMAVKARRYEITINRSLQSDIFILANKEDIWRMAINVIDNAIKYGKVNSTISVNLFNENNCFNIIIEDQGPGISEDALGKLFEPFYREDFKRSEGSGLGLSIVKSIVDKYNGSINIESKLNIGTKVLIQIPHFYNLATS